ncbi:hypothetical protein GCM10009630_20380 [Kribbella jejuensis]|uniref:Uncharacterized protein n=1 Tax=Kribbella jejuensis TaxID=236068 RepID=A0A542EKX4_9ACTN|nr:hypothetical protein [Kribbella jejuensis]TQJ16002.1 hypothetical protein FB475_0088 [Kribbella jejuensis]
MKHSKGSPAERAARPDSRPTKAPAGEVRRQHAAVPPHAGPVKGDELRPDSTRATKPAYDHAAAARAREAARPAGAWPDQQPAHTRRTGAPDEQYVRLRIRVRGDRLTVVDSHLVDGPLAQSATFHGADAYEVTYQDRLLHAGTVADPNTQRSFPNLEGPAEQRGHNVTPREIYEFTARVPAADITEQTRGDIHVRLHRIDDPSTTDHVGAAPLAAQLQGRLTQVAELVGLPASTVPDAIEARGGRTGTGN